MYQNPGLTLTQLLDSEEFTFTKSEAVSDETDSNYAEFTI